MVGSNLRKGLRGRSWWWGPNQRVRAAFCLRYCLPEISLGAAWQWGSCPKRSRHFTLDLGAVCTAEGGRAKLRAHFVLFKRCVHVHVHVCTHILRDTRGAVLVCPLPCMCLWSSGAQRVHLGIPEPGACSRASHFLWGGCRGWGLPPGACCLAYHCHLGLVWPDLLVPGTWTASF